MNLQLVTSGPRVDLAAAESAARELLARGQERLTTQIASCLATRLQPRGAGVVLEAEHTCMTLRGARAAGSTTVTSALQGLLRDDARSRAEFLALTSKR